MIKRFRENVKGYGKIIPKSINIDGQNQPIKTYEQISIDNNGISFNKGYDINFDIFREVDDIPKPNWTSTARFNFALAGAAGGNGGAATNNSAVSRIAVMDPHLLVMMRDVMDSAETAGRLHPQGQATGGGGGGGAGGGGGVVVICTTTASGSFLSSNVDVSGGGAGTGGGASFEGGTAGEDGDSGKSGSKLWIQV